MGLSLCVECGEERVLERRVLSRLGGGQILHHPSIQFKLYQGEVLPYNPGTRVWVESTQSETPEGPFQSERGLKLVNLVKRMPAARGNAKEKVAPDRARTDDLGINSPSL